MTPEQEFRAKNRLWRLQVLQWVTEVVLSDDKFRIELRHVAEAAAVLREYTLDLGPAERMSFVKAVLFDRPGNWRHIWCKPEKYCMGIVEVFK